MGSISNRKKTDMLTYQQREPSPINIVRHVSDNGCVLTSVLIPNDNVVSVRTVLRG